jgi:hypothetical protein
MQRSHFDKPVLFLIFNRPDKTQIVFNAIRDFRPSRLYVAADGPRKNVIGESEQCLASRSALNAIDWDCDLHTLMRADNLGCKNAVSSAITWFFDHEEEGIILEDDCLPHPSAFRFFSELLERYRHDERILMISGDNFQFGRKRTQYSYYFSYYTHIWGWATWRRAWKHYDVNMKLWPEVQQGNWLKDRVHDNKSLIYWNYIFDRAYKGLINTWDHQWHFASWIQNGLTVMPNVNLVTNIGFGSNSTHTFRKSVYADMQTEPMQFPLSHPSFVIRDSLADTFTDKTMFATHSLLSRAKRSISRFIS